MIYTKHHFKLFILFSVFFFFLIFNFYSLSSNFVFAQSGTGVKVGPIRIEELVEPGEVVTKKVKVTNLADVSQIFYVYVMDFTAQGEGGGVVLYQTGIQEGPFLGSWVEATKEGISFNPGQEKEIPITFRVPKEVGPGGYYGAIVFGPKPPQINPAEGSVIALTHQAAVLVLFHVLGEVDENARIREFATDKNIYSAPFRVQFLTRIENLGNVHIKPVGSIKITNMRGKEAANLAVNPSGGNVLPKIIRRFENTWEGNFGFGKYAAFLVLNYGVPAHQGGQGIKTLTYQTSFWIVPWNIVIPAAIGFIFILALSFLVVNLYKNRAVRQALQRVGVAQTKNLRVPEPEAASRIYTFLVILVILILVLIVAGVIFFFLLV